MDQKPGKRALLPRMPELTLRQALQQTTPVPLPAMDGRQTSQPPVQFGLRRIQSPSVRTVLLGVLLMTVLGASVRLFLANGARPEEQGEQGDEPWQETSDSSFTAAPMEPDSSGKSLHEAAADGDLLAVQAQLESGVKLDLPDAAGNTAIEVAIEHKQVKVEQFLSRAESLLLVDEPSGIRFGVDSVIGVGAHWAYYTVFEPYPASSTIAQFDDRLSDLGWTGQDRELFNPQWPNSRVSGWGEFLDSTRSPPQWTRVWTAHWTKSDGTVLRIYLKNLRSEPSRVSVIVHHYSQSSITTLLRSMPAPRTMTGRVP